MNRYRKWGIVLVLGLMLGWLTGMARSSDAKPDRPADFKGAMSEVSLDLARIQGESLALLQSPTNTDRPPSIDLGQRTEDQERTAKVP